MATTKKRLNITLNSDLEKMISKIAKRDNVPEATKAAELLEMAILVEEDIAWDTLAKNREKEGGKFITHNKAWA